MSQGMKTFVEFYALILLFQSVIQFDLVVIYLICSLTQKDLIEYRIQKRSDDHKAILSTLGSTRVYVPLFSHIGAGTVCACACVCV